MLRRKAPPQSPEPEPQPPTRGRSTSCIGAFVTLATAGSALFALIAAFVAPDHLPDRVLASAHTTDDVASQLQRLEDRLVRRLGQSNRDVDERVIVASEAGTLVVTWAIDRPEEADAARAARNAPGQDAREDELRQELRRVLRVLAAGSLPDPTTSITLHATFQRRVPGDEYVEAVVLNASFRAETLRALEADDLRLNDATLAELLGLATTVVGDSQWGVLAAPPPPASIESHTATLAPVTTPPTSPTST